MSWLFSNGPRQRLTVAVELAESVEFKSLPSGLHNVREDLVYAVYYFSVSNTEDITDTSLTDKSMLA